MTFTKNKYSPTPSKIIISELAFWMIPKYFYLSSLISLKFNSYCLCYKLHSDTASKEFNKMLILQLASMWCLIPFHKFSNTFCTTTHNHQMRSVAQSCPTLCDPMNRSTPGLPVHHQLPEFTQTHVHRVSDAIQPSHPLSSPSPPAPNPSQHQGLFQ